MMNRDLYPTLTASPTGWPMMSVPLEDGGEVGTIVATNDDVPVVDIRTDRPVRVLVNGAEWARTVRE